MPETEPAVAAGSSPDSLRSALASVHALDESHLDLLRSLRGQVLGSRAADILQEIIEAIEQARGVEGGRLSYTGVLERFPKIEHDLEEMGQWLDADPRDMTYRVEYVPMERFKSQVEEMLESYPHFPSEEQRTRKIQSLLQQGQKPRPVFLQEDEGDFILEGRHRIVAFFWEGYTHVWAIHARRPS